LIREAADFADVRCILVQFRTGNQFDVSGNSYRRNRELKWLTSEYIGEFSQFNRGKSIDHPGDTSGFSMRGVTDGTENTTDLRMEAWKMTHGKSCTENDWKMRKT
jgi:hypothetical protein